MFVQQRFSIDEQETRLFYIETQVWRHTRFLLRHTEQNKTNIVIVARHVTTSLSDKEFLVVDNTSEVQNVGIVAQWFSSGAQY